MGTSVPFRLSLRYAMFQHNLCSPVLTVVVHVLCDREREQEMDYTLYSRGNLVQIVLLTTNICTIKSKFLDIWHCKYYQEVSLKVLRRKQLATYMYLVCGQCIWFMPCVEPLII